MRPLTQLEARRESQWFAASPACGPDRRIPPTRSLLVEVTLEGQVRRVADLSMPIGQRTFTALENGPDGNFYVASFGELPYPDGSAALWRISPGGEVNALIGGLTTVIDIRFDRRGRLYLLESSTGNTSFPPFLVAGSGHVRVLDGGNLRTVTEGLTHPTSLAFGPRGDLYVSNRGYGAGPTSGLDDRPAWAPMAFTRPSSSSASGG